MPLFRKITPKSTFKALTTGKIKRRIKSKVIPFYYKFGLIKNFRKAIYNKVYHRITIGFSLGKLWNIIKNIFKGF